MVAKIATTLQYVTLCYIWARYNDTPVYYDADCYVVCYDVLHTASVNIINVWVYACNTSNGSGDKVNSAPNVKFTYHMHMKRVCI